MSRFPWFFPVFLFFITACSSGPKEISGPGKSILLECPPGTDSASLNQVISILSSRLADADIDEDEFSVSKAGDRIEVRISNEAKYDPHEIRRILQSRGLLVFRETVEIGGFMGGINDASKAWRRMRGIASDSILPGQQDKPIRFFDLLYPPFNPASITDYNAMTPFMEMPVVGYAEARDTSAISRILQQDSLRAYLPSSVEFCWSSVPNEGVDGRPLYALLAVSAKENSDLSIDSLEKVSLDKSEMDGGRLMLTMNFYAADKMLWARMTKANIGRDIAICVDDQIYSYPRVQSEITGGVSTITGPDEKTMRRLEAVMRSKSLPVQVRIVEEKAF